MNCDEARDLILTDAIDAEISPTDKRELLTHLVACESCRRLMGKAESQLCPSFETAVRPVPPTYIWKNISSELDRLDAKREARPSAGVGLVEWLQSLFRGVGWKISLGAVSLVTIAVMSFSHRTLPRPASPGLSPVASSLSALFEGDGNFEKRIVSCGQFDTPIEKIFFR